MDSAAHIDATYRAIDTVAARVAGTWRDGTPFVRVGGVWKPWRVGLGALITNTEVIDNRLWPMTATAQYLLNNSGQAQTVGEDGPSNIPGEWLRAGAAADYEVRATLISGTVSSGTTGAWQSLATTRQWSRNRTTIGSSSCALTIEIRRAVDSVVVTTATITLSANVDTDA